MHLIHWEVNSQSNSAGQLCSCDIPQSHLKALFRNYDHVSSLWKQNQWIPQSAVSQARAHYAAYSVQHTDGLRMITLNTDFCKCLFVKSYGADTAHTIQGFGVYFSLYWSIAAILMV